MHVPRIILQFLGIRDVKPKQLPQWRVCIWSFLGTFIAISILAILFHYSYYFHIQLHYPTILSSWVSLIQSQHMCILADGIYV